MAVDRERLERAVAEALAAIGDPVDGRPELARTPSRVAEAAGEWMAGAGVDPVPALAAGRFAAAPGERQPIALGGIPFRAFCEHHLVPFSGRIDLAVEPGEHLVGFGRIYDLVDALSSRLTLQERMGAELVDALMAGLGARGAVAVLTADHRCLSTLHGRLGAGPIATTHARGSLGGPEAGEAGRAAGQEALRRLGVGAAAPRQPAPAHVPVPAPVPALAPASERTRIMGILNVTPDSFSDGGRFERDDAEARAAAAFAAARRLVAEGATIIDVGGESTRPGALRVPQAEELARVLPVVRELAAAGVEVSVDTMNAATAEACLDAGAAFINDVSGGLADDRMLDVVADAGAPFILSHWRGHSIRMTELADYGDPAAEIVDEIGRMRDAAVARGIDPERIILDPGLGFAKDADHNWSMLARLPLLAALGHRILIGASRKRFLGELLPEGAPVADRDLPTAVLSALGAERGMWGVRVHEVRATRLALDVAEAVAAGGRR